MVKYGTNGELGTREAGVVRAIGSTKASVGELVRVEVLAVQKFHFAYRYAFS